MRVETFVPAGDWKRAQTVAVAAEQAGFDCLGSPEIAHDPFIPLAMAAVATERIGLRTSIAVAFPRSPMITANLGWDLHAQSGGRFALGLGTQVRAHNERRFSVPWGAPRARMKEYVQALRAIWRCWERGEPLRFEGKHYRFSLMTPEFSPRASGLPPVPVFCAAVRPAMLRMVGEVCDGVRLHGFATRRYLETVALPELSAGLAAAGRARETFEICGGGFVCTGADADAVARAREVMRYRVAFYGSTPAYRPVLEAHGWQDVGEQLHAMSRAGKWSEMPAVISDDILEPFVACAPYRDLKAEVERRFAGLTDTIELAVDVTDEAGALRELLEDVHGIDTPCAGAQTSWD